MPDSPTQTTNTDKQTRLIRAALEVFAEHGVHGTAVPPIARRAGVGVGTLYRYFDNKEALVNAVFRDSKARLQQQLLSGLNLQRPSRSLFNTLWQRLCDFAGQEPATFRFLEMQDHHSYLDQSSHQQELALLAPLGVMVITGQQQGLLNPNFRPEVAIALFWGAFVGLFKAQRLNYLTLSQTDMDQARDACWSVLANPSPDSPDTPAYGG